MVECWVNERFVWCLTLVGNMALAEEYALSTDLAETKLASSPPPPEFSLSEEETLLEPADSSVMSLR